MKSLNNYINEAWSGVKEHTNKEDIKAWCDDMGIKDYTINDNGEIDVDGHVDLTNKNFKELPYKFGTVTGWFSLAHNKNLISLKNCPDFVDNMFDVDNCSQLSSLEGCPNKVMGSFYCRGCKKQFKTSDITRKYKCKVRGVIKVG